MKRFWFVLILMFITMACSDSKVRKPELVTNSVWILETADVLRPGQIKTMKLQFKENGYAYEENTILRYPWKYHLLTNVLEINGQEFKIVESESKRIVLINPDTGIESVLYTE